MTSWTLTWLGHAAFHLASPQGRRILFDPWIRNPKAPANAGELAAGVELILLSHAHTDHLGQTVELAKAHGATVVTTFDLHKLLAAQGVERLEPLGYGGSLDWRGIRVTMTLAHHGSACVLPDGHMAPDAAAGYVVTLEDGSTFHHAGDTALYSDLQLLPRRRRINVAMLPIGGRYTMDPQDAAQAAAWLDPDRIVPMHFGTFPVLTGRPEELEAALPEGLKPRLRVLEPGQSLAAHREDCAAKRPAAPPGA